jgi:hypothetical protein
MITVENGLPVRVGQIVYVLEYNPSRIEKRKVIEVCDTDFRIEIFHEPNMIYLADSSWYTFNELKQNIWIFVDEIIAAKVLEQRIKSVNPDVVCKGFHQEGFLAILKFLRKKSRSVVSNSNDL